jgi:hypothetical protein
VLSNDSDPWGGELQPVVMATASHGALALEADGSFLYTPNANFSGIDHFTYQVRVGERLSRVAQVWLIVSPLNDAPVAADDSYETLTDTPTVVYAASGIVVNDTDAEQDTLHVTLVDDVSNGSLLLNPNGSFLYAPADGFTGQDEFSYRASDSLLTSNLAIVSINVNAPIPPPVANDDDYATPKDSALAVDAASGVLSNDMDSQGEQLLAAPIGSPSNGTLTLNLDGSFLYEPNTGFVGTDHFTYRAVAGNRGSSIATVTISVNSNDSSPQIVTGEISFFKRIVDTTLGETHAVAAADFSGDGEIDLVATDFVDGMVFWYENDGAGGFVTRVLDADLLGAYPVGVGDVDGDGDTDVMAAGYLADTFRWYESDGAGGFTPHDIDTASDGPHSIVTGDIDGDGDIDLLTSSQPANRIAWYENDGANNYTLHIIDANALSAKRAELADVDGDGDMDAVAASFDDNTIAWHENDGNQNFTKHIISDTQRGAYYVFPIDIDADGDTDVYSASKNDASIRWHRNDGPLGFTTLSIAEGAKGARSVIAADINGDGAPDAVAGIVEMNTIAWYANDGTGGFANGFVDTESAGGYGAFAIDMNHDGQLDVLSANRDANALAIHTQGRDHLVTVDRGDTLIIDSSLLRAEDADSGPADLVYTLVTPPSFGQLVVDGIALGEGGTFTQADIDSGLLAYEHGGIDASSDAFEFEVSDGKAPSFGSFSINIAEFTGTIVELPLDDGSGVTAENISGNGPDGTLVNGPVFDANTGDGSAFALRLDGSDDFIDLGVLDVDGTGLTLSVLFNADKYPGNSMDPRLISKASGIAANDHVFMLGTIEVGGLVRLRARVRHGGVTTTLIAGSGNLETGVWYHAAVTDDGSRMRLYLDGFEVGSVPAGGAVDIDPATPVAVGGQPSGAGSRYFDGRVDDVRILSRPMSQAEIVEISAGDNTIPPAPPVEVFAVPLSASSAEISWSDAVDDGAMGTYTLLRDGAAIASNLILPQYVDSGLMSATAYDYAVVAIDAAGNASAVSIFDRVVTLAAAAPVWFDPALAYRIPIDVDANGFVRVGRYLELTLDLTAALATVGQTAALDTNSLRVTRSNASGQVLASNVAFQFDPAGDFDAATNAVGELVVLMEGTAASADVRRYDLYFDVVGEGFTPSPVVDRLAVSGVVDEGQDALLIEAATCSYFFHEQGASLSGLVDSDDNDWISYRIGGGSAGEFRGIPNLVYPESEFHPGGTGGSTQIESQGPLRLRLKTAALANAWQATWSFYDDHVSMTVEQADHAYWFLYEGTPGGLLEEGFDFVTRSDGTQTLLDQRWDQDIEAEEWVYFGDPGVGRSLFLASHSDDTATDTYQTLNGEMTVFGFGRSGTTPLMNAVPRTFSIGLIESTDFEVNARRIRSIMQDLGVAVGAIQEVPSP